MNNKINLNDAKLIKTGSLPKTGNEYALVLLSAKNIDQILKLQDDVFSSIPDECQSFLVRKGKDFFEKHFAENNIVLGVVHNGNLIAQSIIVNPTAKNPETGMVDMNLGAKVDKITVIQGVVVHPEYQGNRLMTVMVDAWLGIAKEQGRTNAIAEVTVANHYSWSVFLKEGMKIHSIGTDPEDGAQLYNMHANVTQLIHKRLKGVFNKSSGKKTIHCPQTDIAAQKKLLSDGYRGVKFDHANGNIEFRPSKRIHKPPPAKHLL